MNSPLKSPFPYFGGKSRISPVVWDRFGAVVNYVERVWFNEPTALPTLQIGSILQQF